MKCEIFILTHKEITENYDNQLYKPLLTGAVFKENPYNYLTDDSGENISDLNDYYAELSGAYWAWKNTTNDIIGFSHRRRWFVKNLKLDKLPEEVIVDDLKTNDIILPYKLRFTETLYDIQKKSDMDCPEYDVRYDDYVKVGQILKRICPEYAETYEEVMNNNMLYAFNMFIAKRETANELLEWLFFVLDEIMDNIDLDYYDSRDKRICGFLSERLITTYVTKNNLKIKEHDIYLSEVLFPHLAIILNKFPRINNIALGFSEWIRKKLNK